MTRGLATPTNGAPSKKEAVRRLMSQGVTSPQVVAEQTGIAIKQVYSLMSTVRSQRGEAAVHRATLERRASFWPQDKLQKAQRLVGKTLLYIARELDVPPAEMIGALGPLLRDSDHFEAVLERMAGGLDSPHQPAAERFKLSNEAGEYLHQHTRGMTRISRFVWRGSKAELDELLRRKPHLNTLVPEPC